MKQRYYASTGPLAVVFSPFHLILVRNLLLILCNLFDMLEMKRHVLSACRTSCATILASAGVAEEEIKTIMRHANINITRKYYDKSNDDRAIMALNRIDEIMDDTPEDRIKKYREQIAELEEKIRFEEGRISKKTGVTLALPVNA